MANYEKRGRRWRARVFVGGKRDSATFPTKAEAVAWATQREAELVGKALPDHTLKDAMRRYASEVSPGLRGERWEVVRLRKLESYPIAAIRLPVLTGADLAAWRDARLKEVSGASVAREMNLLRSVLEVARRDWGWLRTNPIMDVRRPRSPPSRKRGVRQDEIDRLTLAFGLGEGLRAETATHRTGLAFLFAIETAMRSGEITGLAWADVHPRHVVVRDTKNGDTREVPLSTRAREILAALPKDAPTPFNLDGPTRDTIFRRVRDRCKIKGLTFHDTRSEGLSRLSKKLDIMELARTTGHRDLRSLLIYYRADADALSAKLD